MYGPPPDPRQVLVPVDPSTHPGAFAVCFVAAAGLWALAALRRQPEALRAWWFVLGWVVALTAPLAGVLTRYVYGSFPTIDKAGSLLFYLEGVHYTVTLHPVAAIHDPAARLIGVHVGHLWITALFDLLLEPFAAFNAQGILYPALGWWGAALFARSLRGRWDVALLVGFPFGMGLHVFRDLNWYTIEKAAVGFLALFAWGVFRAWRDGGRWRFIAAGLYVGMAFVNWYLALVGAAGTAMALGVAWVGTSWRDPRLRNLLIACLACSVAVMPLVAMQLALLSGPGTLGDPERFLTERAIPDSFTLVPPMWNRLELTRALNGPVLALAALGVVWGGGTARALAAVAAGLFTLALGPQVLPEVPNPVYMALHAAIPGFWRVAKPEVFFEGTWLCLIGVAALGLPDRWLRRSALWGVPVFAAGWLLIVRTHPVFPPFAEPVPVELAPDWQQRVGMQPP
ncbi:MAG: hypothetical protein H6739_03815 [Alphaproteobacteria bacterium]|nr:hypothetical protein [Alphaproteobacteria bacterium]